MATRSWSIGRTHGVWKRHVIDDTIVDGHTIVAGDFDGDGQDEFIVGERQGKRSIYLYRATNAKETPGRKSRSTMARCRPRVRGGGSERRQAARCGVHRYGDREPEVVPDVGGPAAQSQ